MEGAAATLRKLNRKSECDGKPRLVFVNSMSDFFEDHSGPIVNRQKQRLWIERGQATSDFIPETPGYSFRGACPVRLFDLRREAFQVIDECQWLRFLLLTKRPENILRMWSMTPGTPATCIRNGEIKWDRVTELMIRPNVWLGCSVENQQYADSRIPELLKCRDLTPVLWVSYEPAIGPVNFRDIDNGAAGRFDCLGPGIGIDWVVVGGESGHDARPFDIAWARSAIQQCRAVGVPCFIKQLGENPVGTWEPGDKHANQYFRFGRLPKFKDRKAGDVIEWPADIRVRQYPKPSHEIGRS